MTVARGMTMGVEGRGGERGGKEGGEERGGKGGWGWGGGGGEGACGGPGKGPAGGPVEPAQHKARGLATGLKKKLKFGPTRPVDCQRAYRPGPNRAAGLTCSGRPARPGPLEMPILTYKKSYEWDSRNLSYCPFFISINNCCW